MIIVRNRELLIPREEFNIGTNYDGNTETREFRLNRVTAGGIDLTNLTFKLDIKYSNGNTDTAYLDKVYPDTEDNTEENNKPDTGGSDCECDTAKILVIPPFPVPHKPPKPNNEYINLILTVTNNMLQVPGSVLIQIRGYTDDGQLKWTSYQGAFYVEEAINTPAEYTGTLTELEQLEVKISKVLNSEEAREEAEAKREESEAERKQDFDNAVKEFEEDADKAFKEFEDKQIDLTKYANLSKSYAIGGSGIRDGEDTDNSKYYSEQSKESKDTAKEYMDKSKEYMEDTAKFLNATAPNFHVDFDDGLLKYNKESSYSFSINADSGSLEYYLIGG